MIPPDYGWKATCSGTAMSVNTWVSDSITSCTAGYLLPQDWQAALASASAVVGRKALGLLPAAGPMLAHPPSPAAPRGFNRYVNASDLLEEFIEYAGSFGVGKRGLLELPVELFIRFLLVRAAEADGEVLEGEPLATTFQKALPGRVLPRCRFCGRFVGRAMALAGLPWCSASHMQGYAARLALPMG